MKPSQVLRSSGFHERFLKHTLASRDPAVGRALLAAEWTYLEPLLGERARAPFDVLDLACGSSHQALAWAERGARVQGLDFDHALLVAGRDQVPEEAAGKPRVHLVCGDATCQPYADASFDLVFNNSLLEHVEDWRSVLRESARVLRPGGVLVVYTTNRTCPLQQEIRHFPFYSWLPDSVQRRVLAWIMAHRRELVHFTDFPAIHWFTYGGMRQAFREVGLTPYDRLDLIARSGGGGLRAGVARVLSRNPSLKLPYHLYSVAMALYGVRTASESEAK